MTIHLRCKPTDLEKRMDPQFAVFKQEIIEHLTTKITEQHVVEISEVLIELTQESHSSSNFRVEVRLVPQKSTTFDEIRVVKEHKEYIPAIRQAANKAIEVLMQMKAKEVK